MATKNVTQFSARNTAPKSVIQVNAIRDAVSDAIWDLRGFRELVTDSPDDKSHAIVTYLDVVIPKLEAADKMIESIVNGGVA